MKNISHNNSCMVNQHYGDLQQMEKYYSQSSQDDNHEDLTYRYQDKLLIDSNQPSVNSMQESPLIDRNVRKQETTSSEKTSNIISSKKLGGGGGKKININIISEQNSITPSHLLDKKNNKFQESEQLQRRVSSDKRVKQSQSINNRLSLGQSRKGKTMESSAQRKSGINQEKSREIDLGDSIENEQSVQCLDNYEGIQQKRGSYGTQNLMTKLVKTKVLNLQKILTMSQKYRLHHFKDNMYSFLYDKTLQQNSVLYNSAHFEEEDEDMTMTIRQKIERRIDALCNILPVIHSHSKIKLVWDILVTLQTLAGFIWIPYYIAVLSYRDNLYIFIMFVVFLVDIFLTLNTGFFKKGQNIMSRGKIIINYIKHRFLLDLVANFPLVYFLFLRDDSEHTDNRGWDYPVVLLFYIRYTRLVATKEKIQERFYSQKTFTNALELSELLYVVLYFAHIFACVWVLIARIQREQNNVSWLDTVEFSKYSYNGFIGISEYLFAYYFSIVTMSTVGYGDLSPTNRFEMIICIVLMLFACGIFAFILNKIGAIVENIQQQKKKKNEVLQTVNNLMNKKNIDRALSFQIREYVEYYFVQTLQDEIEKEEYIKKILSEPLKLKFIEQSYKIALKDSPIFYDNFSKDIIKQTVHLIEEVRYAPEQVIYKQGDQADCIYFVCAGEVEIFINNQESMRQNKSLCILDKGAFGEIEFFTGEPRKTSIRSRDFTTLFKIQRSSFVKILKDHPLDHEIFYQIKDVIFQNKDISKLRSSCYSCFQNHFYTNCPYITFQSNKTRLIKNAAKLQQYNRIPLPQKLTVDLDYRGQPVQEVIQRQKFKTKLWQSLEDLRIQNNLFYDENLHYIIKQTWFLQGDYECDSCSCCGMSDYDEDSLDDNGVITEEDDICEAIPETSEPVMFRDYINFQNVNQQTKNQRRTSAMQLKQAKSLKSYYDTPTPANSVQKNVKINIQGIIMNQNSNSKQQQQQQNTAIQTQQSEISSRRRSILNQQFQFNDEVINNMMNNTNNNNTNTGYNHKSFYQTNDQHSILANSKKRRESKRSTNLMSTGGNSQQYINKPYYRNHYSKGNVLKDLQFQSTIQQIPKKSTQIPLSNFPLYENNSLSSPLKKKQSQGDYLKHYNTQQSLLYSQKLQYGFGMLNEYYQSKTTPYWGDIEFEAKKDYMNYFPYHNCDKILKKYKKAQQKKIFNQSEIRKRMKSQAKKNYQLQETLNSHQTAQKPKSKTKHVKQI